MFKKRLNEIFLVNCISLLVITSLFILRNCPLQTCSFYLAEVQTSPDVADFFSQFFALGNCSCTWEKIEANLEEEEKRYVMALLEESKIRWIYTLWMISNCFLKDELKAFLFTVSWVQGLVPLLLELKTSLIRSCIFWLPLRVYCCNGKQSTQCSNWQVSRNDNKLCYWGAITLADRSGCHLLTSAELCFFTPAEDVAPGFLAVGSCNFKS